jgi:cell division protein ZapA (FtsZ GTPase activity inhibitor)
LTVAVLTALNISEDLLKERIGHQEQAAVTESEITKLSNYLDNLLIAEDEASS